MESLSIQFLNFLQTQTDEWNHYMGSAIRTYGFENIFPLRFDQCLDRDKFHARLAKTKICLVGDFHTFSPSQRFFCHLMESIQNELLPVQIAAEFLSAEDDSAVNLYLNGEIELKDLTKQIDLARHWPFPLRGYLRILSIAKKRGFKVFGVRPPSHLTLRQTDEFFLERLLHAQKIDPDSEIFMLVGEKHLGESALPALLFNSGCVERRSLLRIFLDHSLDTSPNPSTTRSVPEFLYSEEKNAFCINRHPEWKKWLSVLTWERSLEMNHLRHSGGISFEDTDTSDLQDFLIGLAAEFVKMTPPLGRSRLTGRQNLLPAQDDDISKHVRRAFHTVAQRTPGLETEQVQEFEACFFHALEMV